MSKLRESKLVLKVLRELDFKISAQEAAVRCSLSLEDASKVAFVATLGMKKQRLRWSFADTLWSGDNLQSLCSGIIFGPITLETMKIR